MRGLLGSLFRKDSERELIRGSDWVKMEPLARAFASRSRVNIELAATEFAGKYLGLKPGQKLRELPYWITDEVLRDIPNKMSVPDSATDSCVFVFPDDFSLSADCPEFFRNFNKKAAGKRWRLDVKSKGKNKEVLALPELVSEYAGLPPSEQDRPVGMSRN